MRKNLLMVIFISGLVVGANMRISDNLFHFLESALAVLAGYADRRYSHG